MLGSDDHVRQKITIVLNGRIESLEVNPLTTLMDALRGHLNLRGTKEGCREGECGACTVVVDGMPVDSCIYAAGAADGRTVETVEGLNDRTAQAVKSAMVVAGGVQCGYCTPGIVATLTALLRRYSSPDEALVREALAGNICRCTGYAQIVDAAQLAISALKETQ